MAARNVFWTAADAAGTRALPAWRSPDGSITLLPDTTLSFDDREGFLRGYISPGENADFITINLTAWNSYDFYSEGFHATQIFIFDSQGYLLEFFDGDDLFLFDSGTEDSIVNFRPFVSGTYYILVAWENLDLISSAGWYSIYALEDVGSNNRNDRAGGELLPPSMSVTVNGLAHSVPATAYVGPVVGLQWQFLGGSAGEAVAASDGADFVNLLGGDDAADGRGGSDVLDGGLGSNFLTGGSGLDIFFLDGRGGNPTWATITDWEIGEQLSLWGFRPGVSTLTWVEMAGAPGFQGVTLHADLDGNQTIDASVTWAGRSRGQLPTPLEFDGLLWFQ
jgi:hypothetical protein